MPELPVDEPASAYPCQRRGDEAAVQGVILTIAALGAVDSYMEYVGKAPAYVAWEVMRRFLGYCKTVYPDNERVQSASLRFDKDEDSNNSISYLVSSDIFDGYGIRLPSYQPFVNEPSRAAVLVKFLAISMPALHFCWVQVCASEVNGLTQDELPSFEEFNELVRLCAPSDRLSELVTALDWFHFSVVHFGATSPVQDNLHTIESCRDELRAKENALPLSNWLRAPTELLIDELELIASVVRASESVFADVDELPALQNQELELAKGFNSALIPMTRVMAGEHLSYIRNRYARRASMLTTADADYAEACRLAHFSFNTSSTPRYAKYIAQNLLEIAVLSGSSAYRRMAEIAWIDAYAVPYVIGLTSHGDTPLTQLGWTGPILPYQTSYGDIPPYSAEPDFLYAGSGAEFLRGLHPSFPPDLWAAAVLLTQHFKDISGPDSQLKPNHKLALFEPTGDGGAKFPLRDQHPVAWLLYLAEALVAEHQELRHPHAGLYAGHQPDMRYRRWFGDEIARTFRGGTGEHDQRMASRTLPHVAKFLLRPQGLSKSEIRFRPAIWLETARMWERLDLK